MSNPKRQHLVPQFLLRNFTDEGGLLYYLRKASGTPRVVRTNPKNALVEANPYSVQTADGAKDSSLEAAFSQLEGIAKPRIGEILNAVRQNLIPTIEPEDRRILNLFIYFQQKRVSDVVDPIVNQAPFDEVLEEAREHFLRLGRPIEHDEEERIVRDRERILQDSKVASLGQISPQVMSCLIKRGLTIVHLATPKLSFVIGSNPVVKGAHRGNFDLNDPNVQVILPIAYDTALILQGESANGCRVQILEDRENVRSFNETVFRQSSATVSHSPELLASLAKRFRVRLR